MRHNEDSRVKIPTILHLTRLGYQYLSLKQNTWVTATNIFRDIFTKSILRINPDLEAEQIERCYQDIELDLQNEDLGKAFYERLVDQTQIKLIDFANFDNNSFHVITELPYANGEDKFRPDIILLINGMPLVFIEVKKPNNRDGIIAERKRLATRFANKRFRHFVNITQLMLYSNNMAYDNSDPEPIQGAYYAAPAYGASPFNYFREEEKLNLDHLLAPENDDLENFILADNTMQVIKGNPEFQTNKLPTAYTNQLCTSLLSRERLKFLLQYAIAYVKTKTGWQKHIMRYPQIFATKAIEQHLNKGATKGIIWHTQGSGKTALAYYNVHHLTDYYSRHGIVPKFYFIVDRLDLLTQAKQEFSARGLRVHIIKSREDFAKDIKKTTAVHNAAGQREITVVNIQKFKDDPNVVRSADYNVNIQRIYFLDEVHRSYNPKGSFLANLNRSDKNAIKIGLTGTPLLSDDYNSRDLFGNYIHKYYYNMSIADGYTLRLIREEISTEYKILLSEALKKIEVLQRDIPKQKIFADARFVEPLMEYIVADFEHFRTRFNDETVGGMVVCDSSAQAKMLYKIFDFVYSGGQKATDLPDNIAAEPRLIYKSKKAKARKVKTAAVILHDVGSDEERKQQVKDFKDGKIDFLFVYNMLLTGFDAPRLKKIYLGRLIKRHNLLQALTRVNRRYGDYRYGYVVDFADIRSEFDATNRLYFDELQAELGDEFENYSNLFKDKEEIEQELDDINEALFEFNTKDVERFAQQINQIQDREQLREIVKHLENAKSLYNLIRLFEHDELLDRVDFTRMGKMLNDARAHLQLLNQKEALENKIDTTNLLNLALEDIIFHFTKIGEEELLLADQLKNTLRQTREALADNFDKKDPQFKTLYDALEDLFKKKKLSEVSQDEMRKNIGSLRKIYERIKELNRKNDLLRAKYDNDRKYARVHKRLREKGLLSKRESKIHAGLSAIKAVADEQVLLNSRLPKNESYFEKMMVRLVIEELMRKQKFELDSAGAQYINQLIVKEYLQDYTNEFDEVGS